MYYENHPFSDNGFIVVSPDIHKDFTFPLHVHKNYEFIYVEEGCLSAEINGFDYNLSAGDSALVLSNQPHSYSTIEHSKSWTLIFSPDLIPELKQIITKSCPFYPVMRINDPGLRDRCLKNKKNILTMRSILYSLAATYSAGEPSPHLVSGDSDVAIKIIQYIVDHYAESLTLEQISHTLGYNYRYISGVVNKFYKLPFPMIINRHRIHRACALLDQGENSITEISMLCGFGSTRSFNRNFKSIMKITPKEYKNKAKQG